MFLEDAVKLAEEYGFQLKNARGHKSLELYDANGCLEDFLHVDQIMEMQREDFIEFYLS